MIVCRPSTRCRLSCCYLSHRRRGHFIKKGTNVRLERVPVVRIDQRPKIVVVRVAHALFGFRPDRLTFGSAAHVSAAHVGFGPREKPPLSEAFWGWLTAFFILLFRGGETTIERTRGGRRPLSAAAKRAGAPRPISRRFSAEERRSLTPPTRDRENYVRHPKTV